MSDLPPTTSRRVPRSLAEVARSFFSFGSPRLLATQLACALAARAFLGRPGVGDVIVLAGVAAYWPVQEWVLHRFVLHAAPIRIGRFVIESGAARAHRAHHDRPLEPATTLLPTWTIAVLIPMHLALWKTIAPTRAIACTGVIALGAAALAYEWIHFMTHTAYRPRTRWFREVKRRHLAHHFRDPQRWFAFAVPAVDDWLGTGGTDTAPRRAVPPLQT